MYSGLLDTMASLNDIHRVLLVINTLMVVFDTLSVATDDACDSSRIFPPSSLISILSYRGLRTIPDLFSFKLREYANLKHIYLF